MLYSTSLHPTGTSYRTIKIEQGCPRAPSLTALLSVRCRRRSRTHQRPPVPCLSLSLARRPPTARARCRPRCPPPSQLGNAAISLGPICAFGCKYSRQKVFYALRSRYSMCGRVEGWRCECRGRGRRPGVNMFRIRRGGHVGIHREERILEIPLNLLCVQWQWRYNVFERRGGLLARQAKMFSFA
jgi:hypothetical protein